MRVLIRSRQSSKFLSDRKEWVASRDKALDFVHSTMALNVATRMDLKEVEIVLDFGERQSEVVLSITADSKDISLRQKRA
jgi:hypothetical protein